MCFSGITGSNERPPVLADVADRIDEPPGLPAPVQVRVGDGDGAVRAGDVVRQVDQREQQRVVIGDLTPPRPPPPGSVVPRWCVFSRLCDEPV